jgi:hypothetical protein
MFRAGSRSSDASCQGRSQEAEGVAAEEGGILSQCRNRLKRSLPRSLSPSSQSRLLWASRAIFG